VRVVGLAKHQMETACIVISEAFYLPSDQVGFTRGNQNPFALFFFYKVSVGMLVATKPWSYAFTPWIDGGFLSDALPPFCRVDC
jgi:hypothetical protein